MLGVLGREKVGVEGIGLGVVDGIAEVGSNCVLPSSQCTLRNRLSREWIHVVPFSVLVTIFVT